MQTRTDDLQRLISILPPELQAAVAPYAEDSLLEIVMDLGRLPEARLPGRVVELSDEPVTREALDHVVSMVGEFGRDNRAGIEGTLHRISAIRNRRGQVVGLTLRVGRAVFGTIDLIRDLVEDGRSLLLLGPPGVGKTTKLREVARVLADELTKRVVIIDTSNEIAGDGDVPHPAIGKARRMQVPSPDRQHAVMIEAVENHMPEVIIIDEIGTQEETLAARTIAERGVQLVGTAHGNTLENLLANPTLADLVGGVQTVILSDEEARMRGTQKTVSERKARPTFDVVVEILQRDEMVIHEDTARAVDSLLMGRSARGTRRTPGAAAATPAPSPPPEPEAPPLEAEDFKRTIRIYPYALSRDSIERVVRDLRIDAKTVPRPEKADFVIALRSRSEDRRLRQILEVTGAPLHLVKKNTTAQIRRLLEREFHVLKGIEDEAINRALEEAKAAVTKAKTEGIDVGLAPQPPALRDLQQRFITRHHLVAESMGSEPQRHLVVHPMAGP